jgi:hypothetical protein
MARVTATEVKGIIDTDLTDDAVNIYITSANVMVDNVLSTSDTPILKEIERWLTAHMIASTKERQAKSEEAGGAKINYAGYYGDMLSSTSYGQQVMMLDVSGKFANLGKKAAMIFAIKSFE